VTESSAVDLSGARILVVGSAPLLAPCCNRLQSAGATVAIGALDDPLIDCSHWATAQGIVTSAAQRLGGLDVVVTLIAGDRPRTSFLTEDPGAMAHCVRALLGTAVAVNRAALDVLGVGGRLVNVVSHTGAIGAGGSVVHDACHAAVASLGRNMAQEIHDEGRTVVTLSVGELDGAGPDLLDRHSLGRYVSPHEVAEMVCVGASPATIAAHGSIVALTGGLE
jgi:NADP-dependent 3-hydroxy acid dehydrogenase YdfG